MKHLIDKYRSGDISPEELDILSDMVSKTSDEELSDILHEDWYAFSSDKQRRTVLLSGFFQKKHLSGIAAGIMLVISAGLALSLAGLRSEQKQMAVRLVTVSSEGAGQSTVTLCLTGQKLYSIPGQPSHILLISDWIPEKWNFPEKDILT